MAEGEAMEIYELPPTDSQDQLMTKDEQLNVENDAGVEEIEDTPAA